jgi:hypothetical protein
METSRAPRRRAASVRARTAFALAAAATALAMGALASAVGGDPDHAARTSSQAAAALAPAVGGVPVLLTLDPRHPQRAVPADYLGLSFEATDLQQIAEYGGRGDLVSLLRSLGPGVLRFGGVSSDTRIAWTDSSTPRPAWTSSVLQPADMRMLARLARESGWRVLLTVGLAHYDPQAAAREVAVAKRDLGPWLQGIEVGNEPDAYARHHIRSEPWTFTQYNAEVRAYRRAIARLVPGVALAGPGVSGSHVFSRWGPREVTAEHPALLTGHHYPLGCHQLPAPSIERLLSPQVRVLEGRSLYRYVAVARAAGIPFRMDEANSVSCGGRAGISNTFASALWATGYIAQSMSAGASGINFEGNPANCLGYTAVCAPNAARLAGGGLNAQPLWYALLMSRGLMGDRPIGVGVRSPQPQNLAVSAFLDHHAGLVLSVVDDAPPGSRAANLSVSVGSRSGSASVLTLAGPSLGATSGVTLGGRPVGADGSWSEPADLPRVPVQDGRLSLAVRAGTAELIRLTPAR